MGDEDPERLHSKKVREQQRFAEAKKAEEQLKTTLRFILDEQAYGRITNVQHANPTLYFSVAQHLINVYKRLGRKVKEKELLSVLQSVREQTERKTTISFERK